ncbi:MAG: biotin/lipoyl-containing protein [Bacteroidota bacterium]|nr:biotin/lipoyl-containing protein [Bacteroidota bacterium]MDP4232709.1 biotin/lipoyl-containing protein [Bacteroidota bacterium]MDP4243158.1 biotin/lipoyl-containing protein [Bacteroidota bacterium]MDP4287615.1 biotin/lipoyl-containing protein [Bacteroidota bacterium]
MPNDRTLRIQLNGEWREIESPELAVEQLAPGHYLVRDGESLIEVFESNGKLGDGCSLDGVELYVESERERIIRERFGAFGAGPKGVAAGMHVVKAPMPGMIRSVNVRAGDIVERASTLVILEAMKMENNILAGAAGRIAIVHASEGKSVEKNAALVEIELS